MKRRAVRLVILGILMILSSLAALWLSWALPTEGMMALASGALALAAAALLLRLWGRW
jgi:hypothetical protein